MALASSCQNFTRDAVAGLDRTLHPARPDAIIGVLAREEHSPVEGRRDQGQHRVALVPDRRPHHGPRPGVVRPALDETGDAPERAANHGAHRLVHAIEDLSVGEPGGLDVAGRQPGDDDRVAPWCTVCSITKPGIRSVKQPDPIACLTSSRSAYWTTSLVAFPYRSWSRARTFSVGSAGSKPSSETRGPGTVTTRRSAWKVSWSVSAVTPLEPQPTTRTGRLTLTSSCFAIVRGRVSLPPLILRYASPQERSTFSSWASAMRRDDAGVDWAIAASNSSPGSDTCARRSHWATDS